MLATIQGQTNNFLQSIDYILDAWFGACNWSQKQLQFELLKLAEKYITYLLLSTTFWIFWDLSLSWCLSHI